MQFWNRLYVVLHKYMLKEELSIGSETTFVRSVLEVIADSLIGNCEVSVKFLCSWDW